MNSTIEVSIIMPCYNEERYIARCLDSIIGNDYPKENLEILIYDGGSSDGTLGILGSYQKRYSFLKVMHNTKKIQAAAMNLGIREAQGNIIIRMDAHAVYEKDYISTVEELLVSPDVVNVGGPQVGIGDTYLAKAIAISVSSPFVAGNAVYRSEKNKEQFVDTVYLGAWRKKDLLTVGGFDETFVANEDYELNYRLRAMGGKILFSPAVKLQYFVRASFPKLVKQYFRYGFWKIKTLRKHPSSLVWRQLVAPAFVAVLIFSVAGAFLKAPYFLFGLFSAYIFAFLLLAFKTLKRQEWQYLPLFFVITLSIHLSWGTGFWCGAIYWLSKRNR